MQEKAKVVSVDGQIVSVVPLDIEACIGCSNSECKKNGNVFTACNSNNLDVYPGAEVRIMAKAKNQVKQGLLSIGVPVLCAVTGYLVIAGFLPLAGEGLRIGVSLAALILTGAGITALHHIGSNDLPEIYEVIGS